MSTAMQGPTHLEGLEADQRVVATVHDVVLAVVPQQAVAHAAA